jgi:hypothetical protein
MRLKLIATGKLVMDGKGGRYPKNAKRIFQKKNDNSIQEVIYLNFYYSLNQLTGRSNERLSGRLIVANRGAVGSITWVSPWFRWNC